MLEVTMWSLLVGNLGWQAAIASVWLRRRQVITTQQHEEEEEILTRFDYQEDIATAVPPESDRQSVRNALEDNGIDSGLVGWEFKIVRATGDLFSDPTVFQQLCQEEAQAGWILLEKLDDCRVRFKRPVAMRGVIDPVTLPYDPYRCHYGSSSPLRKLGGSRKMAAGIVAVAIAIVPAYLTYALVSQMLAKTPRSAVEAPQETLPLPQAFPPIP
jgi:hypothetical protein